MNGKEKLSAGSSGVIFGGAASVRFHRTGLAGPRLGHLLVSVFAFEPKA